MMKRMEDKMDTFSEKPKRGELNRSNANAIAWGVIVVGTVLLLANIGILSGIWNLWPLALVAVGVWFLKAKGTKVDIKHEHYSSVVGDAKSARVKLGLPVGETTVQGVDNADTLIDAYMNFVGDMEFSEQGDSDKVVNLSQTSGSWTSWMKPENWNWDNGKQLHSTIGLNTRIPLALDVHGGVGQSRIDLSRVNVSDLDVAGGVGEIFLTLPANNESLDLSSQVGVGRMELTIPVKMNLKAQIKGGVGETRIRLPLDAAVRLEATSGIGDVTVGSNLRQIKGDNGGFGLGKSGVWETENYATAAQKITIHYDGGVGQLTVR